MKKLFALVCALVLACTATSKPLMDYSGVPETAQNVVLSAQDGIIAAPTSSIIFTDDFKGTLADKWQKPLNHANLVTFKTGVLDGKQAMIWINEQPKEDKYDTETAIASKPFSVADCFELHLKYAAKSTTGMVLRNTIIHYGNYDFKISWFKTDEKDPFQEDFFNCETSPDNFVTNGHIFTVPEGAVTAVLHYGFGRPNFQKGQLFAVADFSVVGFGKNGKVSPQSSFVTAPVRLTGNAFDANAKVPAGTSLTFRFSYAPDNGGEPGVWSTWSAPMTGKGMLTPTANAAWVKCKVDFTSEGKAAASVKSITLGNRTIGNWKSIIVAKQPEAAIVSPSPAKATAPVAIKVTAASEINWKASQLLMDGKDAKAQFAPTDDDGVYRFTPAEPFATGVHEVSAKLITMDGAQLNRLCIFYVGEKRVSSPQVTVRHDGMMLIDGKPFFPIGFYVLRKFDGNNNDFDTMFKDLRSRGFNFGREVGCFPTAEKAREFAEAAERNDYKVFMTAGFHAANTQNLSHVAEGVAALQDCKAILMWYIGDDTSGHNTTEMLRLKHETAKAIDPGRITVQADGVGSTQDSNYRPFVNCTDVFHPEIYPLHNQNPELDHRECVFRTIADTDCSIKDIKDVATGPRGVQSIIQFFGSKDTTQGGWNFNRPGEVRAMSYATIIRGATGITWYCYGPMSKYHTATTNPDRWEELCGVARELDSMMDVLTAEPIPQPAAPEIIKGTPVDKSKRPPVYILLKRSEKRTVLMAVNASVDDVTAKITLPGVTVVKELFPTKDYALAAPGVLEIPFTKFQVRVFEVK